MSHIFNIQPIRRFGQNVSSIQRREEITCFSYDDKHQLRLDDSSIKYYYPPSLGADLSKGFELFQNMDKTTDGHIDSLLKSIVDFEQKTGQPVEANLITWRGMMTKLMAAVYSDFDGFEMNAAVFQGTLFIEENHDYQLQVQRRQFELAVPPGRPSQELMSYWGYKFETLCLLPSTWHETSRDYIENRENEIVDNHAQFCSVVKTKLGDTTLILGGEIDGVWDSKPQDGTPANWVELKTCGDVISRFDAKKLERKFLKFWIQSYLLGVPKIVVGFRTPDGILKRVEEYDTLTIPCLVKSQGNLWDARVCLSFASALLNFLRSTITEDKGLWRIRRKERSSLIEVFRIEGAEYSSMLSEEFIKWRLRLASSNPS